MVNRLQENEALIADLDGTVVSCNSFTLFVRWFASWLARKGRAVALMRVMVLVACRKTRLLSHWECKRRILAVAGAHLPASDARRFGRSLKRYLRPDALAVVDGFRHRGAVTVLATAAPDIYAESVAEMAGFDYCVATRRGYPECRASEKLRRVRELCAARGLTIAAVMTDHHDDLPLLRLSGVERYLVSPSARTLAIIRDSGIKTIQV